jgi:hypothetical protein
VFQRYCHVYKEGELEDLVALIPEVEVAEVYYDTGNWVLILRKVAPLDPANDFVPALTKSTGGGSTGCRTTHAADAGDGGDSDTITPPAVLSSSSKLKDLLDASEGTASNL